LSGNEFRLMFGFWHVYRIGVDLTAVTTAAAVAFAAVFVAELGDKSQLVALTFAARHRRGTVLAGIAAGSAIVFGLSVTAGRMLGTVLPHLWLAVASGVLFVALGLWSLRPGAHDDEEHAITPARSGLRSFLAVTGTITACELGDKTMFVAIGLSAGHNTLGVWLGSVAAMTVADGAAVFAGRLASRVVSRRGLGRFAAWTFIVTGVLRLVTV
jgi:putative Ca2+/H+ antiporter (TMEM165/GDT1 family)